MLDKFHPSSCKHVTSITRKIIHNHYPGCHIQNGLISITSFQAKNNFWSDKIYEYFALILDCTPDLSHQTRISLVLRYEWVLRKWQQRKTLMTSFRWKTKTGQCVGNARWTRHSHQWLQGSMIWYRVKCKWPETRGTSAKLSRSLQSFYCSCL